MNKEENRFKSFNEYQSTKQPDFNRQKFAKVGFFATGKGEEIQCYFCNRSFARLLSDDPDAITLHLRTNSSCPLIRRRETDNVECEPFELNDILPPKFDDVSGLGFRIKYPEFVFFDKRFRSFNEWPLPKPLPKDLADSGFFALGESDKVACFSCGLGLMNFEDTDDAYEEHARWGPTCEYLIKTKSEVFVKEIQQKYAEHA